MSKLSEPGGRSVKVGSTIIRPTRKKCVIPGCTDDATSWWPLLPGGPAFCPSHYGRAVEYGADLTPFDPEDPFNT